ncbi:MAG: L,D-transpeptidase family protein [Bacteroidales bacterium]|nr:L,D-transpeptidase family protein [Bacteroidales bacterium]
MNFLKEAAKIFLTSVTIIAIIALIIFIGFKLIPVPPTEEIELANLALSDASARQAPVYSKKLFSEAEAAYDSAMSKWKRENNKFIFFRNYEEVAEYAKLSREKANEAAKKSEISSKELETRIKEKISTLIATCSKFENIFSRYPLPNHSWSRFSKGKLLLQEGEVAFSKSQILVANRKITEAENLIFEVYQNAIAELKNYFNSYQNWKKWYETSVAQSAKNNSYLILVDKFARKCYLYYNGKIKYEFDVELGKNWAGYKRRMGDKATPEGKYEVVRKYQGRETAYYKSLVINYPNSEDIARFKSEIAGGSLPPSSKIGGGIEIHGGGGKGVDWTDGCIALTNANMDKLFSLVKIGTPVTIVGSLKSLDEIMNFENE